jgi:hypothetical protein
MPISIISRPTSWPARRRVVGRTLVPETAEPAEHLRQFSSGHDRIDIDAYGQFVIVSHGFDIHPLFGFHHGFVADSMNPHRTNTCSWMIVSKP